MPGLLEIVPRTMSTAEMLARGPAAIILSGGPASVYAPGAPPAPAGLLEAGVPVLGICYGFQLMMARPGRRGRPHRRAASTAPPRSRSPGPACCSTGCPPTQQVWMSPRRRLHGRAARLRGDRADPRPPPVAAAEDPGRGLYGVQFHPEVLHTEHGQAVLRAVPGRGGLRPDLDHAQRHRRADRSSSGPRSATAARHLRAVRRGGLGGGRRAGPAGHRPPAHLRLRRPRAAAHRRGRAGREGLRGRHRGRPQGRRRRRRCSWPRWPG